MTVIKLFTYSFWYTDDLSILLMNRYIEDNCGTVVISTTHGSTNPPNERYLEWSNPRNSGGLWTFDEEEKRVQHIGGRYFWANRNDLTPESIMKVHSQKNDATR